MDDKIECCFHHEFHILNVPLKFHQQTENVDVKVQLGGGIRDMKAIEFWLNLGLNKVIIGTAALKNPQLVKDAAKNFPNQIIVGIDAKDDFVAVSVPEVA